VMVAPHEKSDRTIGPYGSACEPLLLAALRYAHLQRDSHEARVGLHPKRQISCTNE
jgi:hypothetical protein